MRIAVKKPIEASAGSSAAQQQAAPTPQPTVAPPRDLLALQQIIQAAPASPPKEQPWSLDPAGAGAPNPIKTDQPALGIDVRKPLVPGVDLPALPAQASEEMAVADWMAAHRTEIALTVQMPALIRRVRLEAGKTKPSLIIATDQRILDLIHVGAASLSIPLPKDELPTTRSEDELKAASEQGLMSKLGAAIDNLAVSVTMENGRCNVVALGKTPEIAKDGVQLAVDTGGVTLASKDSTAHTSTALQATTSMGVKFTTTIGPMVFTAGIDPNQWQIGLSFGPDAPDLASLPLIFSNARRALGAAARDISAGKASNPKDLYDSAISPHLPAIKTAITAAKAAMETKQNQVSFGIRATGPGYQPYAAEGAAKGVTVMATLSMTF